MKGFSYSLMTLLMMTSCAHVQGSIQVGSCHTEGRFGNVGYDGNVSIEMNRGDSFVKYKLSDLMVSFLSSEARNVSAIEINSVRLVATVKNLGVHRPYEVIWSKSHSVDVVINENSIRGHMAELEFLMPVGILQRADHVAFAFKNDNEMWPIDVGLFEMYRNISGIGVICPGHKFSDDTDEKSLFG